MEYEMAAAAQLLDLQQHHSDDAILRGASEIQEDDIATDCSVSTSDLLEQLDDCSTTNFIKELNVDTMDSSPNLAESSIKATVIGTKHSIGDPMSPSPAKKPKPSYLSLEARQLLMNAPLERDTIFTGYDFGPKAALEPRPFGAPIGVAKDIFDDNASGEPRVGMNSWQMNVLYRMIPKFAPKPQKLFKSIVATAIERHNEGEIKYNHLPGSIFEDAMVSMDPNLFLETYRAVQNETKRQNMPISTRPRISDWEIAMGYAFALGMKHARSPPLSDVTSMHDLLKDAKVKMACLPPSQREAVWDQIVHFAKIPSIE